MSQSPSVTVGGGICSPAQPRGARKPGGRARRFTALSVTRAPGWTVREVGGSHLPEAPLPPLRGTPPIDARERQGSGGSRDPRRLFSSSRETQKRTALLRWAASAPGRQRSEVEKKHESLQGSWEPGSEVALGTRAAPRVPQGGRQLSLDGPGAEGGVSWEVKPRGGLSRVMVARGAPTGEIGCCRWRGSSRMEGGARGTAQGDSEEPGTRAVWGGNKEAVGSGTTRRGS